MTTEHGNSSTAAPLWAWHGMAGQLGAGMEWRGPATMATGNFRDGAN